MLQLRAIWRNQTGIEDWIVEKADYRRRNTKEKFLHPYHLVSAKDILSHTFDALFLRNAVILNIFWLYNIGKMAKPPASFETNVHAIWRRNRLATER